MSRHIPVVVSLAAWTICGCVSQNHGENIASLRSVSDERTGPVFRRNGCDLHLTAGGSDFSFRHDSRRLLFNGTLVWLNAPFRIEGASGTVNRSDLDVILKPLLHMPLCLRSLRCSRVLIDPGHGGANSGAVGTLGTVEKNLTLDIAGRVARLLTNGILDVTLTRNSDSTLVLPERARLATEMNADILVSIHLNSAANRQASGIETYTLPADDLPSTSGSHASSPVSDRPADAEGAASTILAYHVHSRLVQDTGMPDRGIRHARFSILSEASCPAILVECGFVSNAHDESLLALPEFREELAVSIASGITAYADAVHNAAANAATGNAQAGTPLVPRLIGSDPDTLIRTAP